MPTALTNLKYLEGRPAPGGGVYKIPEMVTPYERPDESALQEPRRDYSPEGRTKFQEFLLQKLGGNPTEMDIHTRLEEETKKAMPEIVERTFGGGITHYDIGQLTPEQQEVLNKNVLTARAFLAKKLEAEKEGKLSQFNFAMSQFDKEASAWYKARERITLHGTGENRGKTKRVTALKDRPFQEEGWEISKPGVTDPVERAMKSVADLVRKEAEIADSYMEPESQAKALNQIRAVRDYLIKKYKLGDMLKDTGGAGGDKPSTLPDATSPPDWRDYQ